MGGLMQTIEDPELGEMLQPCNVSWLKRATVPTSMAAQHILCF